MKKTNVRIMGILLCTIMALTATGCNNDSGNTNAATSNITVAVSKDEYETEVTTLAATEKENNNTETTSGEVYVPSHKVDEIYNTTLEPNISDDIKFTVNFKYYNNQNDVDWQTQYEKYMSTYTFGINDSLTYNEIINSIPLHIYPEEEKIKSYEINKSDNNAQYMFVGISHISDEYMKYYTDRNYEEGFIYSPKTFIELSNDEGDIITNINNIDSTSHIKAICEKGYDNYFSSRFIHQFTFNIILPDGEILDIMAGDNYGVTLNKIKKYIDLNDEAIINITTDMTVIKNKQNTLIMIKDETGIITDLILINNNL